MTNVFRDLLVKLTELQGHVLVECTEEWADVMDQVRTARRPKPPSLKEQALEALAAIEGDFNTVGDRAETIRRGLEALPND